MADIVKKLLKSNVDSVEIASDLSVEELEKVIIYAAYKYYNTQTKDEYQYTIYNNSGSSSVEFNVTPGRKLVINESGASPNPSRAEDFTLWVSHNLGGEDLYVRTTIFNRTGQEVITFDKTELNSTSKFEVITYQDIVSKINAIPNGMFYYRIELKTNDGLYQSSSGKFIILQ